MTRVPLQGTLPLERKDKVLHRQWTERATGQKVRPAPGRPKSKRKTGPSHQARAELSPRSVLHITLKVRRGVPNLRTRRRYGVIKRAFVKFCEPKNLGFRLIHFAVLGNHLHFVVEADSKHALSRGMQKLCHSISRRLNALSLFEHGVVQSIKAGSFKLLDGWLGRVFSERYFAHLCKTPTEMHNALDYVRTNAERHFATTSAPGSPPVAGRPNYRESLRAHPPDPFSSFAAPEPAAQPGPPLVAKALNTLLLRILKTH